MSYPRGAGANALPREDHEAVTAALVAATLGRVQAPALRTDMADFLYRMNFKLIVGGAAYVKLGEAILKTTDGFEHLNAVIYFESE